MICTNSKAAAKQSSGLPEYYKNSPLFIKKLHNFHTAEHSFVRSLCI